MTVEFDIPWVRTHRQREVILSLIEIVHDQKERDFDSFFDELVRLGEDKITEWTDRFVHHDPIERMPKERHDRIRPKLCVLGFANEDISYFSEDPYQIMLLERPPKDDYSDYATTFIDGVQVKFISRIQAVVERFLVVMEDVFMGAFDPRTDSNPTYMTMLNIWANYDAIPMRNVFGHFVFSALVTFDMEICGEDGNPYSKFDLLYEETLAGLFKRVISDRKLHSWELLDITYPLSKIDQAGKLLLPRKEITLMMFSDLIGSADAIGTYSRFNVCISVDIRHLTTMIHEIGHSADHKWGLSESESFRPVYERYVSLLEKNDAFQPLGLYPYFIRKYECFARCYEMYILDSGFDFLREKLKGRAYPKDRKFRKMVKDYFDGLIESLSMKIVQTTSEEEYCNA